MAANTLFRHRKLVVTTTAVFRGSKSLRRDQIVSMRNVRASSWNPLEMIFPRLRYRKLILQTTPARFGGTAITAKMRVNKANAAWRALHTPIG